MTARWFLPPLCVIFFLAAGPARAGTGRSGGSTLLVPASARVAAFAGACRALGGEVDALHCNPAGLRSLPGGRLALSYQSGIADDDFASLQWGAPARRGAWGASLLYWGTGKIDLVDAGGNPVSKTGKRDLLFTTGMARDIAGWPVGVGLQFISSELFGEKAQAVAATIGAQRRIGSDFVVGASLRNLGGRLTYVDEAEPLPRNVGAGIAYGKRRGAYETLLTADGSYLLYEKESSLLIGGELGFAGVGFLRAGYGRDNGKPASEIVNMGLGLRLKKYTLDYAVELFGELDSRHRISLGFAL